ncbi:MAG: hypothetical protein JW869_00770 [Candidatus Omnitrophica bacterium]|nr:hypothetical protein [Candidatus Omnitrophota bacterium]
MVAKLKRHLKWTIAVSCIVLAGVLILAKNVVAMRSQKSSEKSQVSSELIQRMDELMTSIKEKSEAKVLKVNFSKPDEKSEKHQIKISLSGILWSTNNPFAIVNNQIVGLGDEVAQFHVEEIAEQSILLRDKDGNKKTVYMYKRALSEK